MPSKFELLIEAPRLQLAALGQEIKAHRKKLLVSALAVSKAAGKSPVINHSLGVVLKEVSKIVKLFRSLLIWHCMCFK